MLAISNFKNTHESITIYTYILCIKSYVKIHGVGALLFEIDVLFIAYSRYVWYIVSYYCMFLLPTIRYDRRV